MELRGIKSSGAATIGSSSVDEEEEVGRTTRTYSSARNSIRADTNVLPAQTRVKPITHITNYARMLRINTSKAPHRHMYSHNHMHLHRRVSKKGESMSSGIASAISSVSSSASNLLGTSSSSSGHSVVASTHVDSTREAEAEEEAIQIQHIDSTWLLAGTCAYICVHANTQACIYNTQISKCTHEYIRGHANFSTHNAHKIGSKGRRNQSMENTNECIQNMHVATYISTSAPKVVCDVCVECVSVFALKMQVAVSTKKSRRIGWFSYTH